jgi:hypothetical protein
MRGQQNNDMVKMLADINFQNSLTANQKNEKPSL